MSKRTAALAILALFAVTGVAVLPAGAEHEWDHRYELLGTVTWSDGSPARFVEVALVCETSQFADCSANEGRRDRTGADGSYQIQIHSHGSSDGSIVALDVEGERTQHVITYKEDGAAGRWGVQDVRLNTTPTWAQAVFSFLTTPTGGGLSLVVLVAAAVAVIVVRRKVGLTKAARQEAAAQAAALAKREQRSGSRIGCSLCAAQVYAKNLERHLMKVHHRSKEEAEALTESLGAET